MTRESSIEGSYALDLVEDILAQRNLANHPYRAAIIDDYSLVLSRNTYLSYDSSFRVHILPELGDVALADLSRDRVKKFVSNLRKKPRPFRLEMLTMQEHQRTHAPGSYQKRRSETSLPLYERP